MPETTDLEYDLQNVLLKKIMGFDVAPLMYRLLKNYKGLLLLNKKEIELILDIEYNLEEFFKRRAVPISLKDEATDKANRIGYQKNIVFLDF